jgi:crotonobetainyl-CoA:carnitine CoA-transferase CaiB-like acyl-CoA transferase
VCSVTAAAAAAGSSVAVSGSTTTGTGVAPAAQIANAQVNDMRGVWAHPQLRARARWREVETPAGTVPALLPPGSWADGPPRMDAVPALGQHTDAILAALGYSAAAIGELRTAQAI